MHLALSARTILSRVVMVEQDCRSNDLRTERNGRTIVVLENYGINLDKNGLVHVFPRELLEPWLEKYTYFAPACVPAVPLRATRRRAGADICGGACRAGSARRS